MFLVRSVIGLLRDATGFDAVVEALTTGITSASLFNAITAIIPWICGIALFVFAYTLTKKAIKGAAKGKVRM